MTPEDRRIRGADAQALLNNKLFKEAFEAVDGYIEAQALSCKPDDKDMAQRLILSKQLLRAIEREIRRQVEDGAVAEVQIQEINQRRGLRRFIR